MIKFSLCFIVLLVFLLFEYVMFLCFIITVIIIVVVILINRVFYNSFAFIFFNIYFVTSRYFNVVTNLFSFGFYYETSLGYCYGLIMLRY